MLAPLKTALPPPASAKPEVLPLITELMVSVSPVPTVIGSAVLRTTLVRETVSPPAPAVAKLMPLLPTLRGPAPLRVHDPAVKLRPEIW